MKKILEKPRAAIAALEFMIETEAFFNSSTVLTHTVECLHDGSNQPLSEYRSAGALELLSPLPTGI
jgi:hypothetical protein